MARIPVQPSGPGSRPNSPPPWPFPVGPASSRRVGGSVLQDGAPSMACQEGLIAHPIPMPALRPAQRVPHGLGLRSVSKEIKRLFGFGFVFFFFSDSTPTQSTGYRRGRAKRRHGNKGGWVCAQSRFGAAQPKILIAPPAPSGGAGLASAWARPAAGAGGLWWPPGGGWRACPGLRRRSPPGGGGAIPGPRRLGARRLAGRALPGAWRCCFPLYFHRLTCK